MQTQTQQSVQACTTQRMWTQTQQSMRAGEAERCRLKRSRACGLARGRGRGLKRSRACGLARGRGRGLKRSRACGLTRGRGCRLKRSRACGLTRGRDVVSNAVERAGWHEAEDVDSNAAERAELARGRECSNACGLTSESKRSGACGLARGRECDIGAGVCTSNAVLLVPSKTTFGRSSLRWSRQLGFVRPHAQLDCTPQRLFGWGDRRSSLASGVDSGGATDKTTTQATPHSCPHSRLAENIHRQSLARSSASGPIRLVSGLPRARRYPRSLAGTPPPRSNRDVFSASGQRKRSGRTGVHTDNPRHRTHAHPATSFAHVSLTSAGNPARPKPLMDNRPFQS